MAAEAIVSVVLEQLSAPVIEKIRKGVGLVAGAGKAVEILASNLQSIQAALMDAEEKQVNNNAVRVWLDKLKEASYDVDDVLDEWNTKNLKLRQTYQGDANASLTLKKKVRLFFLSPGYCFRRVIFRCEIAFKIKEINERLDVIASEKKKYNLNEVTSESIHKHHERVTSSFVDVSDICGRDEEKGTLVSKLLSESHQEGKGLHTISIVGMGGIGKTTLAQFAYNDHNVVRNFEKRIWVCVSDPFDQFRIAKAILEALKVEIPKQGEWQALLEKIEESITEMKFLLVLDDVWTVDSDKWDPLYNCLKKGNLLESKILVTTRKETVALKMKSIDIITVKELSEDKCWSLFTRLAFVDRPIEECGKLEEVGRKIVGKCKGLPLAIKSVGSLLRFKKTSEEWERILKSEMWNLEECKKDLFPALLLSYNDLPCMIKRCFSYCAIFPKDYNMKKDQLVQLWMAQRYLGLDHNKEMEVIGGEYFDDLAARSFFQDFEKDEYGNIIGCKMHDIVHDFAQSLTKDECFALEVYGSNEQIGARTPSYAEARHSMVTLHTGDASFPISMLNAKKLHSLLISYCPEKFNFSKLFDELKCLRALGIGDFGEVERISGKIGNLIHLRYLNLSECDGLRELPEALCELYNLQTLDITGLYLVKLPQGMGKLINLRHLLNYGTNDVEYMPKGIDRLTCLRTLNEFVVDDGSKGSRIECLKNLRSLRGSLYIRNLGNVDEVKKAQLLEENKYLIDLRLGFEGNDGSGDERMKEIRDEQVLESLQPPSNLEKLSIEYYRGSSSTLLLISNMMLLTTVKNLTLSYCKNFDRLPPLGKLSSLETLNINNLKKVKRVSNEFLGISENNNIGTSSSSSSFIGFPKLKYLSFYEMREWEEWDYKKITRTAEEEEKEDIFMPSLLSLVIVYCKKLKELPHHLFKITTLKELIIYDCPIIKERCRREKNGDYWPMIAHIPTINIDKRYVKRDGVQIQEE